MTLTQRLAINTAATYARSLIAAALAIFSSRWVLNALGQSDYGLYSVVGSVIIFITFLNGVMAGSVARYFAYSIGEGDGLELKNWFNAALSIHCFLALLLVIIGWPVGEHVVGSILTIPPDRVSSSLWVLRISLCSAFVGMVSVPFVAMFTAKQHMAEIASWGLLQSILSFTLAWCISHVHGDRLILYAGGMVSIIISIQVVLVLRALFMFNECTLDFQQWFDRQKLKSIFSFAGWYLFGASGILFRDQGSAILLNLFFGSAMNASYGIASQVSIQTNQLSSALIGSFSPEITASEGRGERERMLLLSHRASKYGTLLVLVLTLPLMIEMEYILKLWLHQPPPFASLFCQLMLVSFLIDRLSSGYMLAIQALGKIAAYQATVGTALILTLPLAWLFLSLDFAPTSIGYAFIMTMTVTSFGRVLWGRKLLGISIRNWIGTVVRPGLLVAVVTTIAAESTRLLMEPSLVRLILVVTISMAVSIGTMWVVALDCHDRAFFTQSLKSCFRRVRAISLFS
jgi:O-antigen/teichoic acid export membrane protein